MGRPRPKRGERRIDAAIDHLALLGFPKPQIRRVMNDLLKLYGSNGWILLEEDQYRVVLDKLLEEEQAQPQKDQQPEAAVAEEAEAIPENDMQVSQENHMQGSPENHMQFSEVQNVGEINKSALQPETSHKSPATLKSVLPVAPAVEAVPARSVRPPCHGWISEESDTESGGEDGEVLPVFQIPSPRESVPVKRKRPSRWDVGPN